MKVLMATAILLATAASAMAQPIIVPVPGPGPGPGPIAPSPGPGPAPVPPPPPDTTPPADTTSLVVTGTTMTSATLQWTAPGDNGTIGTATQYDVRYSTLGPIVAGNWSSATQVAGEPAPLPAGSTQSMTVTGLAPGTTYWFALRTADEVPNWSNTSNSPAGTTVPAPDMTAPAPVPDLTVVGVGPTWLSLQWTAPGDDGMSGTATAYDLRMSTTPIVTDADFNGATPVTSGVPVPAAAGTLQNGSVDMLAPGTQYWFAIKTRDEVNNWSTLSNSATGVTSVLSPDEDRRHRLCSGSASGGACGWITLVIALLFLARRR